MAELPLSTQEEVASALGELVDFGDAFAGRPLDEVLAERNSRTVLLMLKAFEGCPHDNARDIFLWVVHFLIEKYLALQDPEKQFCKEHVKVLLKAIDAIVAVGFSLSLEPKISKALLGRGKGVSLGNIHCEREQLKSVAIQRLYYTVHVLVNLMNQDKLRNEIMWNFSQCILGIFAWLKTIQHEEGAPQYEFLNLLDDCFVPLCIKNLFALMSRLRNGGLSPSDPLILSTGSLLTSTLLRPNGLLSFIRAFGLAPEDGRLNRMAKLSSVFIRCPHSYKNNPSQYYRNILTQCLEILCLDSVDGSFKSACYVIVSELYKSPYKVYANLLGPLIWGSLLEKCQLAIEIPDACSAIQGDELTDVLTTVHKVFANSNHELFALLDPFVDFLLSAYVDVRFSNSTCAQQLSDILWFYFEKRDASSACCSILKWLKEQAGSAGSPMRLRFDDTEDGKLVAEVSSQPSGPECIFPVNALLSKISATAGANIFFALLPILCTGTIEVENFGTADPDAQVIVALSSTVEALLDRFSTPIFSESRRLLDLCRTLLESAMRNELLVTASTVGIVLGILEVAVSYGGKEEAYSFCRIQPTLEKLAATYPDTELRLKASQLLSSIIEEAPAISPMESDTLNSSSQVASGETFDDALRFLGNPGAECIGHGLILLRRLIMRKDAKALQNMSEILSLAAAFLQNDDSYVFLSAIAVLVCAVRHDLRLISEEIIGIFVNFVTSNRIGPSVRLAEAISIIGRSLGDLAPHYIDVVVPAMLSVYVKAEDFYLRASCLVAIGSIMQGGQFKVSSYLNELLLIIERAVSSEEDSMVVSAALHLLQCLLEGAGGRLLSIFGDSILPVYRQLKSIYSGHRREEVHRLHAQVCLEQIDVAMRRNLGLSAD